MYCSYNPRSIQSYKRPWSSIISVLVIKYLNKNKLRRRGFIWLRLFPGYNLLFLGSQGRCSNSQSHRSTAKKRKKNKQITRLLFTLHTSGPAPDMSPKYCCINQWSRKFTKDKPGGQPDLHVSSLRISSMWFYALSGQHLKLTNIDYPCLTKGSDKKWLIDSLISSFPNIYFVLLFYTLHICNSNLV